MSYGTSNMQKFTMIDDLPDLDDLEMAAPYENAVYKGGQIKSSRYPGASMLPNGQEDKFAKFIRSGHQPPSQAGMVSNAHPHMARQSLHQHQHQHQHPHPHPHPPVLEEPYEKPVDETKRYAMPENTPSCLNVAEHIANCPICSKFYNDDKSIYIIAIIVLAVICILLLKKVLDR